MPNENTSLKIVNQDGDSNTTHDMVIGKNNAYHRPLLIVAGSLLAVLVLIAVAGKSGGQYLASSAAEIAKGRADALAEYQVDSANSALEMNIFGMSTNPGDEICSLWVCEDGACCDSGFECNSWCTSCGGHCGCHPGGQCPK